MSANAPIPAAWLPDCKVVGITAHWTGGSHTASSLDKEHYHFLWEADGDLVKGLHSIKDNEEIGGKSSDHYAAHTKGANTKRVGVSLCCMAGATESPFNPGKFPMTEKQFLAMAAGIAQMCRHYGVKVTDKTVITHAEVQANLGIKQNGKWDYTRLAFDPTVKGAKACGDKLRAAVSSFL